MKLFADSQIDNYLIPIFLFLIIACGDADYLLRPLLAMVLPALFLFVFFLKHYKESIICRKKPLLVKVLILYLLWILITAFFAYNTAETLYNFVKLCIFFGLIYVVYEWLDSPLKYKLLINACCYATFCLASIIIIQYIIFHDAEEFRIAGTYSNLNTGGLIMAMSAILNYYAYIVYKKNFYILSVFLCTLATLCTGSRAALLALLVAFAIVFIRRKVHPNILVAGLIGLCAGLLVFIFKFDSILHVLRLESGTAGRNYLWSIACQIIQDNFWTGIGAGNLKSVGTEYMIMDASIPQYRREALLERAIGSSHNMYLESFVDSGLTGFILYLIILLIIVKQYQKDLHNPDNNSRHLAYITFGMTIGIIVRGFFESNGFICKGWLNADLMFWIFFILYKRKQYITWQS